VLYWWSALFESRTIRSASMESLTYPGLRSRGQAGAREGGDPQAEVVPRPRWCRGGQPARFDLNRRRVRSRFVSPVPLQGSIAVYVLGARRRFVDDSPDEFVPLSGR